MIALHGRFKIELGENCHLMPVVRVTNSGLKPTQRMFDWYGEMGVTWGPVFRNSHGMPASSTNPIQLLDLEQIGQSLGRTKPSLFPDKRVDILADYSTRRSFRRGATTRAEIFELLEMVTNLNNRWQSVEKAKGKRIHHSSMRSYYLGIQLMLTSLPKFSQAMSPVWVKRRYV